MSFSPSVEVPAADPTATVDSTQRALREATQALCASWSTPLPREQAMQALHVALRLYVAALSNAGITGSVARDSAALTVRNAATRGACATTDVATTVVREVTTLLAGH